MTCNMMICESGIEEDTVENILKLNDLQDHESHSHFICTTTNLYAVNQHIGIVIKEEEADYIFHLDCGDPNGLHYQTHAGDFCTSPSLNGT